MRIGRPQLARREGTVTYRVVIDDTKLPKELWFGVDERFADLVSDSSDAALAALLVPAMERGEDVFAAGPVSERLHYNAAGPLQRVLRLIMPALREVAVTAGDLAAAGPPPDGVATPFSAGIDSFVTLADHHGPDAPPGFRITHLLFNNVGSQDRGGQRLFRARLHRLRPFTEGLGLPLVAVDSNLDDFYGPGGPFLKTHPMRNVAVALLLQRGIGRYLYSAGDTYEATSLGAPPTYYYPDPVTLPLFSTERLDAVSVGGDLNRVEKTLRVSEMQGSYRMLDVCADDAAAGNCSRCIKCLRTQFIFEVAGVLDRYSEVFDDSEYRSRRTWYLGDLSRRDAQYQTEIRRFAKESRFSFPLAARMRRLLKPALERPVQATKRAWARLRGRSP